MDHMTMVRARFGALCPRMAAGVGRGEALRPIRSRPVGIVPLQRRSIVLALVSEQLPELLDRGGVRNQTIPVIMRDLVPEMTEQRAVGFAHRFALAFSFGGVGLRHVEGDEAATVPSHDRRLALRTADRDRQKRQGETVETFGPGVN